MFVENSIAPAGQAAHTRQRSASLPCPVPPITAPLKRGPWRYLSDRDVLHAAVVTLVAIVLSLGLVWVGYLIHVWHVAARSPLTLPRPMTVLVFGRRLVQDQPESDYQQRLGRALALMRASLTDHVLLLGGRSGGSLSEAAAGRAWLDDHELPPGVLLQLEQASVDSLENLRHARSLLQEYGPVARVLPPVALVSSRYHLARCQLLARRLGFECVPVAAEPLLEINRRYIIRLLAESGYLMWIDLGARWGRLIGHRRITARLS
ncbi:MAG TPA: YdcF family protein [Dyella sp.]|uniref:YdcF family protein n=1 Tax=Dyella sp. TaxID=1869338 RepID=UPI002D7A12B0|nr:YdcF family protein [Dyella sp.]HET6553014.1 YdcF family protein [Dyella sp.]